MILNTIMKAVADGYPYETGDYIPTSDSRKLTISFANIHPKRPALIVLVDTYYQTHSAPSTAICYAWGFEDWSQFVDPYNDTPKYGAEIYSTKESGSSFTTYMRQKSIDTEAALDDCATRTEFYPNGQAYYFQGGHTLKWIAIWL